MNNFIEEYLVRIGADVDQNSFNTAALVVDRLAARFAQLGSAGKAMVAVMGTLGAVTKTVVGQIKGVADAEMEYQKLAQTMWTTRETAKSLQIAMKTMGASAEDIAWVPELREQFFRLRQEMNALATPADADGQLRYIREIGYDIQVLFVKLKALREWVVYYLIKYLAGPIAEFKKFISWLSTKVGNNISSIAQQIAKWLARVVSWGLDLVKLVTTIVGGVYDFFQTLPSQVKEMVAVFAVAGAAIMSGPFGMMLVAIGAALLLLQDFYYYMQGWDSSSDLAPLWAKLAPLVKGNGEEPEIFKTIREFLTWVYDMLNQIFIGLKIDKTFDVWIAAIGKLKKGFEDLMKSISKADLKGFFRSYGEAVGTALRSMGRLVGLVGKFCTAIAMAINKDFAGAGKYLLNAMVDFGKETAKDVIKHSVGGESVGGGPVGSMPVEGGEVTSGFGYQEWRGRGHDGIDIGVEAGTPVKSMEGGIVTHAANDDPDGYGAYVQVRGNDGYVMDYGHLSAINVNEGDRVESGSVIGLSGGIPGAWGSGSSLGEHLHWRVHDANGNAIDPRDWRPTEKQLLPPDEKGYYDNQNGGSSFVQPGSYAETMGSSYVDAATEASLGGGTTINNSPTVNVYVNNTNASPEDIVNAAVLKMHWAGGLAQ